MIVHVDVLVPFEWCEQCPQMEIGTVKQYEWKTGKPTKAEFHCVYSVGCQYAHDKIEEHFKEKEGV